MQELNFLEAIKRIINCNFISDLKYRPQFDRVWLVCSILDLNVFPLEQLEDAAEYFFGKHINFTSKEQALEFFKSKTI